MKAWLVRRKPSQLLILGFLSYVIIGVALLSLPFAQKVHAPFLDNLFNVASAMSTTGLTTISVVDSYTWFGQLVILALMQLGGIGYMTLTSFLVLARRQNLSPVHEGILKTGFALPGGVNLRHFITQVVWFTLIIETVGALVLWRQFELANIPAALWQAMFHSVSAFATAGFSLWNNSLEQFAHNPMVNIVIAALCYLGALGFIVLQDAWLSARIVERRLTLTSKIILMMTGAILVIGAPLLYLSEPSLNDLTVAEGIMAAIFQVMTASTTAGFNTIPIGALAPASLLIIIIAMLVGASPSGTGGGIKTTSVSALYAILASTLRGQREVRFWKHTVPAARLRSAVAGVTLYVSVLAIGLFALCLTERHEFLKLLFEAASALGTVGLSMGITGDLSATGKLIITALMFIGRVGPLTLGFSIAQAEESAEKPIESDLAV